MTVSPGEDSGQDRAAVILTPDQRVRVFISSTLKALAEERAAALRAIGAHGYGDRDWHLGHRTEGRRCGGAWSLD